MHKKDAITIMKRGGEKKPKTQHYLRLICSKRWQGVLTSYPVRVPDVYARAMPGNPTGDQSPTGLSAAQALTREKLLPRADKRRLQRERERTVPHLGSTPLSRLTPRLSS